MVIPVLLAGGEGRRLWPLSNTRIPKQFLTLGDENKSFYQKTLERVCHFDQTEHLMTVTSECYAPTFSKNSQSDHHHILFEPSPRNTAAAITFAALFAKSRWENPVLWITPCDHHIIQPEILYQAITEAIPLAKAGKIVTFGITPTTPSSHYGYIIPEVETEQTWYPVQRFIEKPASDILSSFYGITRCYWNSGMFLFSADNFLRQIAFHTADLYNTLQEGIAQLSSHSPYLHFMQAEYYEALPALPIDTLLMEKSDNLTVFPVEIGWSDVGTWQSLWEFTQAARNDNVASGECRSCVDYLHRRYAHHF